jgi:hypothetical protein
VTNRFIEISDEAGLVTVVNVELDGYTRIHRSLLLELLHAGGYYYEEDSR